MRLVNDKQEPIEVKSVDLLALVSQMFLVALGIATWVFSPMTMVMAHCRFTNPWSKVAGIGGALLALILLEVPLAQVVLGFVFGLFVGDSFQRQIKPMQLLSQALMVGLGTAVVELVWGSVSQNTSIGLFWTSWVGDLIEKLKATQTFEGAMNWSLIKDLVTFEGPFLYLSALLLSSWIALGSAAHFGWVNDGKSPYSSVSLRELRLPHWVRLSFIVSLVATMLVKSQFQYLAGGIFRVLSGLMFIQGTICLSVVFSQRGIRRGVRTLVYSVAILLGFYALVGMGIMSPWILRKRRGVSPQAPLNQLEEQT
ncbi:MAG: hypothetical protein EBR01_04045 [Proteobacteria bacterium]|nr:hypothetical protein [Pseudomonadota bacterium]